MILFVDDLRNPEDRGFDVNSVVTRSSAETISWLEENGVPDFITFDHDLGGDDTAMDVVDFLIERDLDTCGEFISEDFTFNVHSDNPVGKANIEGKLNGYLKFKLNA